MTIDDAITLFHAPQSRSAGVLTLLEELGAPYELKVINMKAGEQRRPDYMAINPLARCRRSGIAANSSPNRSQSSSISPISSPRPA
ncbi:MAG: glutathione S-transferase N-terminal domain-containing protein [Aliidongia sp.]